MASLEFRMPSLGADMEVGTLMRWLVRPGDTVHRGDVVAIVDTEKADIEVEVFADGVVAELLVAAGEKVPVGTLLARLLPAGGVAAEGAPLVAAPTGDSAAPTPLPSTPAAPPSATLSAPVLPPPSLPLAVAIPELPRWRAASPAARARATALGVDLTLVAGSGPQGAVTLADVDAAAARAKLPAGAPPEAPGGPRPAVPRRALAALMERANREVPHYYLTLEIDLSRALAWLAAENARRDVADRLLPAALLLKAVALAARDVPEMNGSWVEGGFRAATAVHVGVAVSRRGGEVVVPALRDVDRLALGALMAALREVVTRARSGSLRSSELVDATLTVTNVGDLGADAVLGVVYPPQVALVGFGRIADRPWVEAGRVVARPLVTASLAADHRASDGYRGGRFLAAIAARLQTPEEL